MIYSADPIFYAEDVFEPYGPDHLADVLTFPDVYDPSASDDRELAVETEYAPIDSYLEHLESERTASVQGQLLFEADYLRANRLADGSFDKTAEDQVRQNHRTALGEAEVHSMIMTSIHQLDRETGYFIGFGKSTVDIAREGRNRIDPNSEFHDEYKRSDIELDDELDAHEQRAKLQSGQVKLFVSPSPTKTEMSETTAKKLDYDGRTVVRTRAVSRDGRTQTIKAISIFGITTEAWGKVLLKRGVELPLNPNAKDIMKAHSQMYFEAENADVLELVESAADELGDEEKEQVLMQVRAIRENQQAIQHGADYYVEEWLEHTMELANSRDNGRATKKIGEFIDSFYDGKDSLLTVDLRALVDYHRLPTGEYRMTKELGELVEVMKRNTLWIRAGTKLGNKRTLDKLDQTIAERIVLNETLLQSSSSTVDYTYLQRMNDYLVATQNVNAGGGCAGGTCDVFGGSSVDANGNIVAGNVNSSSTRELRAGEYVFCPDCGLGQRLRKEKDENGKEFFVCRGARCAKKVAA